MNEIGFQNSTAKISAVNDGIQTKSSKNSDSTFKGILEKVSSDTKPEGKKNLNVTHNSVNSSKSDITNDSKANASDNDKAKSVDKSETKIKKNDEARDIDISNSKAKTINSNGTKINNDNDDAADNKENSIKLSDKELFELKSIITKLLNSKDSNISSEDKLNFNLNDAIEIIKKNLDKINDALDTSINKILFNKNVIEEINPSQINLDLIQELSKVKNELKNVLSILAAPNTNQSSYTHAVNEKEDGLYLDLSEHSMNAEKKDTKAYEVILSLCGMASILSQIASIKTEQLQSTVNNSEVQAVDTLKDLTALSNSLTNINELLKSYTTINPENQKNYEDLSETAIYILSSEKLNLNNSQSAVNEKSNIITQPTAKGDTSSVINMMNNKSEDLRVDSEVQKLINKFMDQADKLEQKITLSKDLGIKEPIITTEFNAEGILENNFVDPQGKINAIVKKKLLDRDFKIDIEKTPVTTAKANITGNDVNLNSKQNSANVENTNKNSLDEENKLLLKLSNEEKDYPKDDVSSKIARATNLVTSLQIDKNLPVELAEKVPVINRQTFNDDLVKSLKYMELNEVKELTVKVVPKELGELFIKITREGEVVKAQITATNKEAYNVLNSNLSDITNKLSEQNIKIHSFNVEIFNGDSSYFNQGSNSQDANSQGNRRNSFRNLEVEDINNDSEDIFKELNNLNALA